MKFFDRLTTFFQGRHTMFVIWFAISAFILSLCGKLTGPYVGMCSVLQACVFAHSVKEDYMKQSRDDSGAPV